MAKEGKTLCEFDWNRVGCIGRGGVVEKFAIVVVIEWLSEGMEEVMSGIGNVPLQEVRICVFGVLVKQPSRGP